MTTLKIDGAVEDAYSGYPVSSAGDINGDGFDDRGWRCRPNGNESGSSYVIYGKNLPFSDIDLGNLNPADGFRIVGAAEGDSIGNSVSTAGDFNGNGFDDVIISADGADGTNGDGSDEIIVSAAYADIASTVSNSNYNSGSS